jgi:hypothetical protein
MKCAGAWREAAIGTICAILVIRKGFLLDDQHWLGAALRSGRDAA